MGVPTAPHGSNGFKMPRLEPGLGAEVHRLSHHVYVHLRGDGDQILQRVLQDLHPERCRSPRGGEGVLNIRKLACGWWEKK